MKSVLTLLFSITITFVQAQNFIDNHFSQYADLEETTVVHVAAKTFEFASYVIPSNDEEERELKDFVASVKSLDLINVKKLESARTEYNRGKKILERSFDELLNIKDKSSLFSFFINADEEYVYEVVGIGVDDEDFFVVSVTGAMKLDIIASIISKIDSDQLKPLSKLREYDASQFEVYPNPVNSSSDITIEIPEGMLGGTATILDLKGASIHRFTITQNIQSVKTDKFAPGTYIVSLEKNDISLKKQMIVVR